MLPNKLPEITPVALPIALPDDSYFLPADCAVWYKMDSASSLKDYTGNGITGVPNVLTLVDGPSGKVLSFSGAQYSYLNISALSISSYNQTFEFWLKPVSITENMLFAASAGVRNIRLKSDSGVQTYDTAYAGFNRLITTDWQHIVWTIIGGISQKLYVNSVKYDQSYGSAPANVVIGGAYRKIGSDIYGTTYNYNGLMGCFRAYSRALDASEVVRLFEQDKARYGITG